MSTFLSFSGPATIRMVSTNSTPPLPLPMQVPPGKIQGLLLERTSMIRACPFIPPPPGHMVQQILDQNGTLEHVILSLDPMSQGASTGSKSSQRGYMKRTTSALIRSPPSLCRLERFRNESSGGGKQRQRRRQSGRRRRTRGRRAGGRHRAGRRRRPAAGAATHSQQQQHAQRSSQSSHSAIRKSFDIGKSSLYVRTYVYRRLH